MSVNLLGKFFPNLAQSGSPPGSHHHQQHRNPDALISSHHGPLPSPGAGGGVPGGLHAVPPPPHHGSGPPPSQPHVPPPPHGTAVSGDGGGSASPASGAVAGQQVAGVSTPGAFPFPLQHALARKKKPKMNAMEDVFLEAKAQKQRKSDLLLSEATYNENVIEPGHPILKRHSTHRVTRDSHAATKAGVELQASQVARYKQEYRRDVRSYIVSDANFICYVIKKGTNVRIINQAHGIRCLIKASEVRLLDMALCSIEPSPEDQSHHDDDQGRASTAAGVRDALLATADANGFVRMWRIECVDDKLEWSLLHEIHSANNDVFTQVVWSPPNIASASSGSLRGAFPSRLCLVGRAHVEVWELAFDAEANASESVSCRCEKEFAFPLDECTSACFTADGNHILTSARDGAVTACDLAHGGRELFVRRGRGGSANLRDVGSCADNGGQGLSTITHILTVPPSLYDSRSTQVYVTVSPILEAKRDNMPKGGSAGLSLSRDLVVGDDTRINGVRLHLVRLSDGSELDTLCVVGGEQSLDFNQVHIDPSGEFLFAGFAPALERAKWPHEKSAPKSACGLVAVHLRRELQFGDDPTDPKNINFRFDYVSSFSLMQPLISFAVIPGLPALTDDEAAANETGGADADRERGGDADDLLLNGSKSPEAVGHGGVGVGARDRTVSLSRGTEDTARFSEKLASASVDLFGLNTARVSQYHISSEQCFYYIPQELFDLPSSSSHLASAPPGVPPTSSAPMAAGSGSSGANSNVPTTSTSSVFFNASASSSASSSHRSVFDDGEDKKEEVPQPQPPQAQLNASSNSRNVSAAPSVHSVHSVVSLHSHSSATSSARERQLVDLEQGGDQNPEPLSSGGSSPRPERSSRHQLLESEARSSRSANVSDNVSVSSTSSLLAKQRLSQRQHNSSQGEQESPVLRGSPERPSRNGRPSNSDAEERGSMRDNDDATGEREPHSRRSHSLSHERPESKDDGSSNDGDADREGERHAAGDAAGENIEGDADMSSDRLHRSASVASSASHQNRGGDHGHRVHRMYNAHNGVREVVDEAGEDEHPMERESRPLIGRSRGEIRRVNSSTSASAASLLMPSASSSSAAAVAAAVIGSAHSRRKESFPRGSAPASSSSAMVSSLLDPVGADSSSFPRNVESPAVSSSVRLPSRVRASHSSHYANASNSNSLSPPRIRASFSSTEAKAKEEQHQPPRGGSGVGIGGSGGQQPQQQQQQGGVDRGDDDEAEERESNVSAASNAATAASGVSLARRNRMLRRLDEGREDDDEGEGGGGVRERRDDPEDDDDDEGVDDDDEAASSSTSTRALAGSTAGGFEDNSSNSIILRAAEPSSLVSSSYPAVRVRADTSRQVSAGGVHVASSPRSESKRPSMSHQQQQQQQQQQRGPAKPNPEDDAPPNTNTILHRLAEANAAAARSASSVVTKAPGPVSIAAAPGPGGLGPVSASSFMSPSSSSVLIPSRASSTLGVAGSQTGGQAESPEEDDNSQDDDEDEDDAESVRRRRVLLRRDNVDNEGVVESSASSSGGGVEGERRVSVLSEEHQDAKTIETPEPPFSASAPPARPGPPSSSSSMDGEPPASASSPLRHPRRALEQSMRPSPPESFESRRVLRAINNPQEADDDNNASASAPSPSAMQTNPVSSLFLSASQSASVFASSSAASHGGTGVGVGHSSSSVFSNAVSGPVEPSAPPFSESLASSTSLGPAGSASRYHHHQPAPPAALRAHHHQPIPSAPPEAIAPASGSGRRRVLPHQQREAMEPGHYPPDPIEMSSSSHSHSHGHGPFSQLQWGGGDRGGAILRNHQRPEAKSAEPPPSAPQANGVEAPHSAASSSVDQNDDRNASSSASASGSGRSGSGRRPTKKPEAVLLHRLEKLFQQHHGKIYDKIGADRHADLEATVQQVRQTVDEVEQKIERSLQNEVSRLDGSLRQQSHARSDALASAVDSHMRREFQKTVVPQVTKMVTQSVQKHISKAILPTLQKDLQKLVQAQIRYEFQQGNLIPALADQIPRSLQPFITQSFANCFQNALIPDLQKGTQAMFSQIDATLKAALDSYLSNFDLMTSSQSQLHSLVQGQNQSHNQMVQKQIETTSLLSQQLAATNARLDRLENMIADGVASMKKQQEETLQATRVALREELRDLREHGGFAARGHGHGHGHGGGRGDMLHESDENKGNGGKAPSPEELAAERERSARMKELEELWKSLCRDLPRIYDDGEVMRDVFIKALYSHSAAVILSLCGYVSRDKALADTENSLVVHQTLVLSLLQHLVSGLLSPPEPLPFIEVADESGDPLRSIGACILWIKDALHALNLDKMDQSTLNHVPRIMGELLVALEKDRVRDASSRDRELSQNVRFASMLGRDLVSEVGRVAGGSGSGSGGDASGGDADAPGSGSGAQPQHHHPASAAVSQRGTPRISHAQYGGGGVRSPRIMHGGQRQ